ncbi:MAG: DUF2927 domain-containing protein, partial [Planktomarina sp.]
AHLTNKLSQASGHPMAISADGNLHVLVLSEDERLAAAPLLRSLAPSVRADDINLIRHLGRSTQCVVMAFQDPDQKFTYNQAIVVIRAELSMHLKRTCLHEEITQGMGLSNDSPTARPSVFNDDDEFSFVTDHDMALLKLLYHPNLRPGMSHAQARPIVNMVLGLSTPQDQGM